ncbi:MAG: cupin domain-containing protein [Candidatus Woesearchaeota archaeon]
MKNASLDKLEWHDRFTYVKNVPFDEKDLNCKGARFQIVKFLPHTKIEPHYHLKTHEIFYIQSGHGMLKLNNKEFKCAPNDFFLCQPGDVHEFVNDTNKEFVILIFKTNESSEDIMWTK